MRYVKWTLLGLAVLLVGAFLHYTLPRQDVVRIVNTEVQRIQTGGSLFYAESESLSADGTRDVKIIHAIRENGSEAVYRNEDTGWGWPPYFKFNSANIHARAADLTSTSASPRWVLVKRYGWRSQLFSIYPNVVNLTEVEGPRDKPLPVGNIVIFALLGGGLFGIYRLFSRFYARRIDPVVDRVVDVFDGDGDTDTPARQPETEPEPGRKGLLTRILGR